MEGAGSRVGRSTSRYGQQASTATFSGPVRRWEKKWVHVSSLERTRHQQKKSNQTSTEDSAAAPGVLLCKWTPLSQPQLQDPPPTTKKLRYTPIAVLEEKKRTHVNMVESRATSLEYVQTKKLQVSEDESYDGLLNINQSLIEDEYQVEEEGFATQEYLKGQLNLEMPLMNAQEDSSGPGW